MLRANYIFETLATILTILLLRTSKAQSLSVTLTTTTINANSIYSFSIVDTNLQNRDGTMHNQIPLLAILWPA